MDCAFYAPYILQIADLVDQVFPVFLIFPFPGPESSNMAGILLAFFTLHKTAVTAACQPRLISECDETQWSGAMPSPVLPALLLLAAPSALGLGSSLFHVDTETNRIVDREARNCS